MVILIQLPGKLQLLISLIVNKNQFNLHSTIEIAQKKILPAKT